MDSFVDNFSVSVKVYVSFITVVELIQQFSLYTQSNKNQLARNFLSPELEVTCGTVAIII